MGDVFDAMNRAQKEGQVPASQPEADPSPVAPQDETPGLPIDQVPPAGKPQAAPARITAASNRPVADATDKAEAEADPHPPWDEPIAPPGTSLNGYSGEIITHHDRGSVITEQYRAIRTQILARGRNRRLQVNTLTSAAPSEGKSVTTINLGITFSELRNQNTLLIEGDLRRPTFARLFHRDPRPGLTQLLKGEVDDLNQIIHPTVYDNLQVIPSGGVDSTNSTELLSSPRMAQLIDRVRDRYDHIFIDTPPVLNVTDASILGAVSDQTIMIVRLNKTPSEVVERTKRLLRAANCDVAGVVLTHLSHSSPRYLYRYAY
jgi:capsular exopolysaccharide synthesis family protein